MKTIVVVGGTSGIAESCMRVWNQQSCHFILVVRNLNKAKLIEADLKVRNPTSICTLYEADFHSLNSINLVVNQIAEVSAIDIVMIAHGSLPDQELCQHNLENASDALWVNGVSPVLFAEAFVPILMLQQHAQLAIIGSVAGDRGRKSNYIYGAAKGLVATYVQGLQHRLAGTGVKVSIVKPGPTQSPMTQHLSAKMKLADTDEVAKTIVKGLEKANPVIYAPGKWCFIMLVIRHLPAFVFNKLNI